MRQNSTPLIVYGIAAALLFSAGWLSHGRFLTIKGDRPVRRVAAGGYRFTSPLLDVELPEGISIRQEPIPFKHKIDLLIQQKIREGLIREAAVYYRDLYDGPWFAINENAKFHPASMMKVAVMISWLKRAESDQQVLKKALIYSGGEKIDAVQDLSKDRTIEPGRSYTVETLLHYMMHYSDNNATAILYRELKPAELNAVLDGMDVDNEVHEESNIITVHGYSGFFRILYNAAYLNRQMSEKALELLSLQDFPEGIVAGVPPGTVVASKYGVYSTGAPGAATELHEFGIVYHPTHPFIIGIMTRGNDFATQKKVLAAIARQIYEEVSSAPDIKTLP